jgi:hypothetical protein
LFLPRICIFHLLVRDIFDGATCEKWPFRSCLALSAAAATAAVSEQCTAAELRRKQEVEPTMVMSSLTDSDSDHGDYQQTICVLVCQLMGSRKHELLTRTNQGLAGTLCVVHPTPISVSIL